MSTILQPIYNTASPQQLEQDFSAICSEGLSPATVQAMLLWVIRYHFSDSQRIADRSLKNRVWTTDDGLTSAPSAAITIEPAYRWKLDNVQQRPGVFIRRQAWQLKHLGMFGSAIQNNAMHNLSGEVRYEREVSGSHVIFSVSKLPAEADALAWEITTQLEGFSVNIGRDMDLVTLRVAQLGDPVPLEESEKHWTVPVVVSYIFNRSWAVRSVTNPVMKFNVESVGV